MKSTVDQRLFSSPEEAVKALQAAVQAKDKVALADIFGPEIQKLLTGDAVQDANNMQRFSGILGHGYAFVKEGEDKITIEVGKKNWPMPIPLAKINGKWYFDTAAGKDEIINRHIGKDELNAIGICRAYVTAQLKYAAMNPEAGTVAKYAQKFRSTLGKKDGLYWPSKGNEPASPFGALVAQACAEGYCRNKSTGLHPYYGYYFRVLTGQGEAAPGGKMDYMSQDGLTKGFALVAYPVRWGQSGIMTFIVNQGAGLSAEFWQKDFPYRGGNDAIRSGQRMDAGAG